MSRVCFTEGEALLGIVVALTALCYLMTAAAKTRLTLQPGRIRHTKTAEQFTLS